MLGDLMMKVHIARGNTEAPEAQPLQEHADSVSKWVLKTFNQCFCFNSWEDNGKYTNATIYERDIHGYLRSKGGRTKMAAAPSTGR